MFVRLTNAVQEFAGEPIYINMNRIVSILEVHVPGGSLRTILYADNKETFQVEESLSEVTKLIERASK